MDTIGYKYFMGGDTVERTFIMIKPDGVKRGLMGEIISRIEKKGFKIRQVRLFEPSRDLIKKHYEEHVGKIFYDELTEYILSGPVMAMEVEGDSAVAVMRLMIGNKDPRIAAVGTIRGDFASSDRKSVV